MRTLLWKIKFRNFEKAFGFVPMSRPFGDPSLRDAEQGMVDKKLKRLAVGYCSADHNEQTSAALLREAGHSGDPKKFLAARDNRDWNRNEVRQSKQVFWHAHGLAKKAGFSMRDKYTDYLDRYEKLR